MDQAQSLREYMQRFQVQKQKQPRVITITSGKGGVGKSNFTINFALALKAAGKKVIVLDLDLTTANINILMGVIPKYNLADVLISNKSIWDVLEIGTGGIEYLAGGIDLHDVPNLEQNSLGFFMNQIQELQHYADFILLDTGAGISKELVECIAASDETILITTPEPTVIADSYAVLKTMVRYHKQSPDVRLVVNRAQSYREAVETSRTLKNTCSKFLKMNLPTLGFVMEDPHVRQSVKMQMPFYLSYPKCEASKNIEEMIHFYLPGYEDQLSATSKGLRGFFEKIFSKGITL